MYTAFSFCTENTLIVNSARAILSLFLANAEEKNIKVGSKCYFEYTQNNSPSNAAMLDKLLAVFLVSVIYKTREKLLQLNHNIYWVPRAVAQCL